MSKVNRYERGWPGHFICADRCLFRRNTLLECGESRVVVSTVGLMENPDGFSTIGHNRYFETMAFYAEHNGRYWDADVTSEVEFESPWAIADVDADDRANDMHEAVVEELTEKMAQEAKGEYGMNEKFFTFEEALTLLKNGERVARKGWNGNGMFLYLVDGSTFEVNRPPLDQIYPEGTRCTYRPHIDMRTADGELVPWVASQTDLLADDWYLI